MPGTTLLQIGTLLRQLRRKAGITSLDQLQEELENDRRVRGLRDTFPISREYLSAVEHGSFVGVCQGLLGFYRQRGALSDNEYKEITSLFVSNGLGGTDLVAPLAIPGSVHARTQSAQTVDVLACTSSSILPWLHLSLKDRAADLQEVEFHVRIILMQWNPTIYSDASLQRHRESYQELMRAVRRWKAIGAPEDADTADLAMLGVIPRNLRVNLRLCHNTVLRAFLFDLDTDAAEGFIGFYEWRSGHLRGIELPMLRVRKGRTAIEDFILNLYTNRFKEMWLHGDQELVPYSRSHPPK